MQKYFTIDYDSDLWLRHYLWLGYPDLDFMTSETSKRTITKLATFGGVITLRVRALQYTIQQYPNYIKCDGEFCN